MNPENHTPMCDECKAKVHTEALTPFTCKGCGEEKMARFGGDWHYCDKCGTEHNKCTCCGNDMPKEDHHE